MSNAATTPSAQPNADIIDVPFAAPIGRAYAVAIGLAIPIAAVLGVILATVVGLKSVGIPIGAAVFVLLVGLAFRRESKRVVNQEVAAILDRNNHQAIPDVVEEIIRSARYFQPMAAMKEMTRLMARSGREPRVLRVAPAEACRAIEPLKVPFEPQPLDEADTTFRQLSGDDSDDPASMDDAQAMRRVKRNIYLKGGWWIAIILGANVLVSTIDAIIEGRVSWSTVYWVAIFLTFLFIPLGAASQRKKQALLVPGGLVVRTAVRHSGWSVRLFRRNDSTLCVYRVGRRQWTLAVADGEGVEMVSGTPSEMHLALRAWFSPLPPPSLERLTDLA